MTWLYAYLLFQAIIILAIVIYVILNRKKDKRDLGTSEIPEGFQPTNELNIDPTTQQTYRVYYHPQTGERRYVHEKKP